MSVKQINRALSTRSRARLFLAEERSALVAAPSETRYYKRTAARAERHAGRAIIAAALAEPEAARAALAAEAEDEYFWRWCENAAAE
jgi:hypothetical protein